MNDFTKEELQIIHLDMTTYVNRTPMLKESPSHKELRDKIQFMIDNYHECVMEYCGYVEAMQCKECGKRE